ncbi:MAG: ferredoxin [Methanosarcinales archaeon]|nr:ferredoxin [Methanosarcinales archaeon]
MADKENKVIENVPGPFYVDEGCIGCRLCTNDAPENFKMNDDGSTAFVFKQPENDSEIKDCDNAIDSCPVEAIGNDG